mmetsp:Transcript_31825/g.77568  ORF Transcript_31825/g.77568 Transcript_31825/m.77568 type:complete len:703 (-) Transcript_31825:103-2211(-)
MKSILRLVRRLLDTASGTASMSAGQRAAKRSSCERSTDSGSSSSSLSPSQTATSSPAYSPLPKRVVQQNMDSQNLLELCNTDIKVGLEEFWRLVDENMESPGHFPGQKICERVLHAISLGPERPGGNRIDGVHEAEKILPYMEGLTNGVDGRDALPFYLLVRCYLAHHQVEKAEALIQELESCKSDRTMRLRFFPRGPIRRVLARCKRDVIQYYVQNGDGKTMRRMLEMLDELNISRAGVHRICMDILVKARDDNELAGSILEKLVHTCDAISTDDAAKIVEAWSGSHRNLTASGSQSHDELHSPVVARSVVALESIQEIDELRIWEDDLHGISHNSNDEIQGGDVNSLRSKIRAALHPAATYRANHNRIFDGDAKLVGSGRDNADKRSCFWPLEAISMSKNIQAKAREKIERKFEASQHESSNALKRLEETIRERRVSIVVDAANVGFHSQNHIRGNFSYSQIDSICQALIKLEERPLLIAPPRYVSGDLQEVHYRLHLAPKRLLRSDLPANGTLIAELSDEDKFMIERWRQEGLIFETLEFLNDDLFWMYATLLEVEEDGDRNRSFVSVVSNDRMRDHQQYLVPDVRNRSREQEEMRELAKWQSRQIRFQIWGEKEYAEHINLFGERKCDLGPFKTRNGHVVELKPSPLFFRDIQTFDLECGGKEWHIPVRKGGENRSLYPSRKQHEQHEDDDLWLRIIV